jgi:hypothetical protein
MVTMKSAKKTMDTIKTAAADRMDHITTNEKIVGAAALGVAVGVAATAIGSSMLHGDKLSKKAARGNTKAAASKD